MFKICAIIRNITKIRYINLPVYRPPIGVLTPLARLTALRENEPSTGYAEVREAAKLQIPRPIISCVASTESPEAKNKQ